jgi:hypothetical protein
MLDGGFLRRKERRRRRRRRKKDGCAWVYFPWRSYIAVYDCVTGKGLGAAHINDHF